MSYSLAEKKRINIFAEEFIQLQLKYGVKLMTCTETGEFLALTREECEGCSIWHDAITEKQLRQSIDPIVEEIDVQ